VRKVRGGSEGRGCKGGKDYYFSRSISGSHGDLKRVLGEGAGGRVRICWHGFRRGDFRRLGRERGGKKGCRGGEKCCLKALLLFRVLFRKKRNGIWRSNKKNSEEGGTRTLNRDMWGPAGTIRKKGFNSRTGPENQRQEGTVGLYGRTSRP